MLTSKLLIAAGLVLATMAHAAPTPEQCSGATELGLAALKARRNGVPLDSVLELLRQNNMHSGLPVWAVKQAYKAPNDVPEWMFRGALFGECQKRDAAL